MRVCQLRQLDMVSSVGVGPTEPAFWARYICQFCYEDINGSEDGIRTHTTEIFLLLHITMAASLRCSLDYVFTVSYDLGGSYIVSTHL